MLLRVAAVALLIASPAAAQMFYEDFRDEAERTRVDGPWARYQTHVLKLSQDRYAVLFRPGFVDAPTAIRAVAPLCAARGRSAVGEGTLAPVDLVRENGEDSVLQGYRVICAKPE
ncbi:hypothetical protein [Pseudogemmobacter humi]|uniref:Uncharacterized protein n=1 Tax=Pseudogemmobacter humi TaxID=2483812 RepID=A0A3P5WZE1_9RHOB|nr:hypothetical protein [Pseudogemmobacter humi]VDC28565.1 hypothetical protein XINFAN_02143 [Pseudogemmobacter humi]